MVKPMTANMMRDVLGYNPLTGIFTWIACHSNSVKAGDIAGCKNDKGYLQISVFGVRHKAHRMAWLHVYGKWPDGQIDHIDGNRENNRIQNLRDVTANVNLQNQRRAQSSSTHGYMGVTRRGSRWRAQIKVNGHQYYLGTFDSPEEANLFYIESKRQLHPGNMM